MRWLDAVAPVRMTRITLVAPEDTLRDVLVRVADSGTVEIDPPDCRQASPGEAAARLQHAGQAPSTPVLSAERPDLGRLEQAGRYDVLAGEAQLEEYAAAAARRPGVAALAGWIPAKRLPVVAASVAEVGGAVVPRRRPPGIEAPTLLRDAGLRGSLTPLVQTYGTVPYADVDPTWLAWVAYVLMFGMMFGDAGQGMLLVAAALALRAGWPRWARRYQRAWPFIGGAGVAATGFGLLYGECFGPTGLVPTLWLDPLSHPTTLLLVAAGIGVILLALAYGLGTINRWREGGWPTALYAPSGIAGISLFLGAGAAAVGWYLHQALLTGAGALVAAAGLALALIGFLANAGGGSAGTMQASVEAFDFVVRLGSNVVSFTRLAAFGLTHAALGMLVWEGTRALWDRGGVLALAGVILFAAGTALAFSLEALVAAIQALRLEYYELFSRVFVAQGRPFRPWHVSTAVGHVAAASETESIPALSAGAGGA
jgi:V/A-type H+/Na+-transporting ATPase subunit I